MAKEYSSITVSTKSPQSPSTNMKKMLRKLYLEWFKPYRSIDVQLVSYRDADVLISLDNRWVLAKQEDSNLDVGMVWLEKREYITE